MEVHGAGRQSARSSAARFSVMRGGRAGTLSLCSPGGKRVVRCKGRRRHHPDRRIADGRSFFAELDGRARAGNSRSNRSTSCPATTSSGASSTRTPATGRARTATRCGRCSRRSPRSRCCWASARARGTQLHRAFKVQFLCAQRGVCMLLNISAKFWRISESRTDERSVTAQASATRCSGSAGRSGSSPSPGPASRS